MFAEDFANEVELTEEQQILLLEEYEKEIASKKNKTKDIANNNERTSKNKKKNQNKNKTEKNKTPKKVKSDECGNLVEDYFGDKEQVKDDASSNSDESWEKEFEIEDTKPKA